MQGPQVDKAPSDPGRKRLHGPCHRDRLLYSLRFRLILMQFTVESLEFKRQAVELVIHSGKTQAQIARELGVSEYS